jgi:two-component system, cell cycle sensor histidine kinase and response regulator CckA
MVSPRAPTAPPRPGSAVAPSLGGRLTLISAVAATLLGSLGLAGWITPWSSLATLGCRSIPMAPSTALLVLLLGVTLIREAHRRSARLTATVSWISLLLSALQLSLFIGGFPPLLDALLVPSPEPFGIYLAGRMSPWTALGLVLSSLSLLFVSLGLMWLGRSRRHRTFDNAGVVLAAVVVVYGLVVVLGYLFDAPLLYGSPVVPMALPSALALVLLGLAVLGLAPRESALLNPFFGPSPRATLLRAFIPIVPALIILELMLAQFDGLSRGMNAALAAISGALLAAGLVSFASHGTGRSLTRAQSALRESEASFRELADAVPQMVWVARPDRWILYSNQRWVDYTGQTLEESLGRGWSTVIHPDDRPRVEAEWARAIAAAATVSVECRLRRSDGAYKWWLVRGVPLLDSQGGVLKWYGTFTDIDERVLAERLVAESEERFSKIFHSGLVAFSIAERESGLLIDVNERWATLFGYRRDEAIGRTVFELGLWEDNASRDRFIASISLDGNPSPNEATFRRRSGEVFDALAAVEPMTLTGNPEPLMFTALIDVTERKRLEAQLLQAQKMEAVGRLAGGVAHDFNNALAVIQGYTEVLLSGAIDDDERSSLGAIQQAATRAADLTRQLLAFSRKEIANPRAVELNALLANLEKMMKPLLGEDIDLAILPGANLGLVRADPGQMEQAVINLCINARHAMPKGGRLRIATADVDGSMIDSSTAGVAANETVAPGRYVMVEVRDSGSGIDRKILPRIFEPFFTTKEAGVGTGLGLTMVYGSITQAGGHVRVESELGSGTTVRIYLPRFEGSAEAPEAEKPAETANGSETILLVEDEAALRTLVSRLLVKDGYRVIGAGSGPEALLKAAATMEEIHLVISDVVMPGMNGRELVDVLSAVRPGLRVIFVSGYTDDILASHGVLEPGTVLLAKPFTRAALLGTVHEALRRPPAFLPSTGALN